MLFGDTREPVSRGDVLTALIPYAAAHVAGGGKLGHVTRHILGLYHGQPRGRVFRRHLSENAVLAGASGDVLGQALALVSGPPAPEQEAAA
jgi:tRNA-dihydrouridine synthase A